MTISSKHDGAHLARLTTAQRVAVPLTQRSLRDLALRYAGRYAVTKQALAQYLARKMRERGWSDTAPFAQAAEDIIMNLQELGVVSDQAVAAAVIGQGTRRGLGAHQVQQRLRAKGVSVEMARELLDQQADSPLILALRFAEKRHFGPFRREGPPLDAKQLNRELAAMVRAGHTIGLAHRIVRATSVASLMDADPTP